MPISQSRNKIAISFLNGPSITCSILFFFCFAPTLVGQDSIQKVEALEGDGIYSLLRRYDLNPAKHYQNFVELNSESLAENNQLYVGSIYQIPYPAVSEEKVKVEVVEKAEYSIFGKNYSTVESAGTRLKNTVYYLISGHGGPDPGAIDNFGGKIIAEDEYAYDVTLRLARELLSHAAEVYIIIQDKNDGIRDARILDSDTDEVVYPNEEIPLNQVKRLKQRVKTVNGLYLKNKGKYQRLIVTHVDGRSKGTNIDVFFYHHHKSKNGKRLAENIHRTFEKKYKKFQPHRKYTGTFTDRSGLYLVKNTLPAMTYIEIGNIRNKKDQRRILDPDNRQALAKWISEGILTDFETRSD